MVGGQREVAKRRREWDILICSGVHGGYICIRKQAGGTPPAKSLFTCVPLLTQCVLIWYATVAYFCYGEHAYMHSSILEERYKFRFSLTCGLHLQHLAEYSIWDAHQDIQNQPRTGKENQPWKFKSSPALRQNHAQWKKTLVFIHQVPDDRWHWKQCSTPAQSGVDPLFLPENG